MSSCKTNHKNSRVQSALDELPNLFDEAKGVHGCSMGLLADDEEYDSKHVSKQK